MYNVKSLAVNLCPSTLTDVAWLLFTINNLYTCLKYQFSH